ncbi:bacterio-opsin activator domain-containing protein [Natrinema marinum]|uniref:bacterio-opsin activator domain-containing protein n=1 Tax=Natrinema marinum TaxID=2961598 RepID=UPI0020C843AE|nr:bacterio-opsin activator domain-containing protein [Natrinema marinum]
MSDGATTVVGDAPRVLVVGDSKSADDAMAALEAGFEGGSLLRARSVVAAGERLADREVHCLVCPYGAADASAATSTLERLADRADGRPIVAVADEDEADRALEAGASDVVDRHASEAVFTARVRTAAERERYRLAAADARRRSGSILERADAVVWVVDADGAVAYATPAVESRLGYTPAELERASLTRIVHPDDREAVTETIDAVAAAPVGTTERVTCRLGRADGTWRVSALSCTNRLADPAVEGIVITDTGAPAADSAVDDAVRAGIDRLEDAVFAIGPRDELQYANAAALSLFAPGDGREADARSDRGPGREIPTGTVVWDLLPDGLAGALADRVREARATESMVSFEAASDSFERPLTVDIHPGADGVSIRASDRGPDAAAAADRDRLALLESVVDALDDGVAVLEDGTVRLANPALRELAGTDDLIGRDLAALFDADLASAVRERARSPVVRWMDPVSGDLAIDASRPVDVFVAPLSDPDRTLCVVRDRRGSPAAALETVRRTARTLREAETPSTVRSAVVDAVREYADADLTVWYLASDDGFRPAAIAAAERVAGGDGESIEPPWIDPEGTPLADALEDRSPTIYDRGALRRLFGPNGLRAERILAVPIAADGVVLATGTEPLAFERLDFAPIETLSDAATVALAGLKDAADLRACRRERSHLEAVAARTERLWDAERSMLNAETRADVERLLCEAVVSLTPLESAGEIELVWVGHADDGREAVVPTTWAGRDGAFLESTALPQDREGAEPTGVAAATREPTVVDDLAADSPRGPDSRARATDADTDEAWRQRLLERGFRSALSVPVAAGEVRYGTLTAYADRPSAFDERTRRVCAHLAAIAGAAIAAIETTEALLADRITELEIVLRDDAEPLSAIAHRLGSPLDVRAVVPRSTGGSTVFCAVAVADPDAARESVASVAAVDSVSVVGGGTDDAVLEIALTERTIARTVADRGGVLRSVSPVDDRTRLTIELGEPIAVRPFVRAIERTYSGAELIARRERDRLPRATRPFDRLGEHLSERQRRTLEAAYYGGFFEWPREHTGEEVADSLGVSQPTFSRHLRLAQRKLFALLFDDGADE